VVERKSEGEYMSSENTDVKALEKKVETLTQMIENITKSVVPLGDIPDLSKKLDAVAKDVGLLKSDIPEKSSFDEIKQAVDEKDVEGISEKIDALSTRLEKIESDITEVKDSKELDVLYKKVDDILLAIHDVGSKVENSPTTDNLITLDEKVGKIESKLSEAATNIEHMRDSNEAEIIGKKIEDLQHYVAGLSSLEEKVDDMSKSFAETKEIVGIIVRQLDDIERKYNKSIEDINEAMEVVKSLTNSGYIELGTPEVKSPEETKKGKSKDEINDEPTIMVDAATIDELMKQLLIKVKPTTEAKEMALTLEQVRDKLTTLIKGHTPILFQFGTRARELKSYPPTATLNENDIARLNKEIRDWTSKLKKIATET